MEATKTVKKKTAFDKDELPNLSPELEPRHSLDSQLKLLNLRGIFGFEEVHFNFQEILAD